MTTPDEALGRLAQAQHGAFTRAQALEAGVSVRQLEGRLAARLWQPLHPRVYCAGTTNVGRPTRAVAARLYLGPAARFSHLTAAQLHGIDSRVIDESIWLTIPHSQFARRRPGLLVSRSRHLPTDARLVHGQPALPLDRTVVDLAQVLDAEALRWVLRDVVGRGRLKPEHVLGAAEGLGGRPGLALLHEVLKDFDPAAESEAEREADLRLQAAGIFLQRQVEVWEDGILLARLDLADEERKVGLEVDGHRDHAGPRAVQRDKRRDRMLARRGWDIVRVTPQDVYRHPQQMVRDVDARLRTVDARRARAA